MKILMCSSQLIKVVSQFFTMECELQVWSKDQKTYLYLYSQRLRRKRSKAYL